MDFLKMKWSYWFTTLDVNNHGMVTRADLDKTLSDFLKVEKLSETEGQVAVKKLDKWWNTYVLKGKPQVLEAEFLKDLEMEYKKDPESFKTTYHTCVDDIIRVLDTDHTNAISLDNYIKGFKFVGQEDETILRKSFQLFKPVDGLIPIEEYINWWTTFLTNDDPDKKDVFLEIYKAGFLH